MNMGSEGPEGVRIVKTALFLIIGAICSSISCTAGDDFGRCDGTMKVTTVAGNPLLIQWSPTGCEVYQLAVDQGGVIAWSATMVENRNGIASSVSYGVNPSGSQGSNPQPLIVGPYRVLLYRIDDMNRVSIAAQGDFDFQ